MPLPSIEQSIDAEWQRVRRLRCEQFLDCGRRGAEVVACATCNDDLDSRRERNQESTGEPRTVQQWFDQQRLNQQRFRLNPLPDPFPIEQPDETEAATLSLNDPSNLIETPNVHNGIKSFMSISYHQGRRTVSLTIWSERHTSPIHLIDLICVRGNYVVRRLPVPENQVHGSLTHGINVVRRVKADNKLVVKEIKPEEVAKSGK